MDDKIEHIVISGGGPNGFLTYGVLKQSNIDNFWNINNIKSIYATSSGSIIGLILMLKYEWEILDNYIINRPWYEVFNMDINAIIYSIQNKGIFNINNFIKIFIPLFNGKDIPLNITLKEFYEKTNIEFHIFSVELYKYNIVNFSYKTHPDFILLNAVYCSCGLPFLFSPFYNLNECYIDGGLLCNYPLKECINEQNILENENNEILNILGLCNYTNNKKDNNNKLNEKSNIFDYIILIFTKIINNLYIEELPIIKYQISLDYYSNIKKMYEEMYICFYEKEKRKDMINKGINIWNKYINKNIDNL